MNRLLFWIGIGCLLLWGDQVVAQSKSTPPSLSEAAQWMKQASRHFQTNPDSALHYLERALPVFEREEDWQSYAQVLNGIVGSLIGTGEFQLAEEKAQEAVQKSAQLVGKSDRIYLDALNNLSAFYRRKGDFQKALDSYREALGILQTAEKKDFGLISRTYYNIGIILRHQGNPEGAIRYYEKALDAFRSIQPDPHPNDIRLNFALARAYEDLNQWEQERARLQRCQDLIQQFSAKKYQRYLIDAYHRMAYMQSEMEAFDSAAYFVRLARQNTPPGMQYRQQVGEEILADIAWEENQIPQAMAHYRQALRFSLEEWGKLSKSPSIARAYQRLAERKAAQNQWDSASYYYFQGLTNLSNTARALSPQNLPQAEEISHPFEAIPMLEGIANCTYQQYLLTEQQEQAALIFALCNLADQSIKRLRRSHQEDQAKLRLGSESRKIYEIALELAYLRYQQTQERSFLDLAFQFTEQSKAMVLYDALQSNMAGKQVGLPENMLAKERQLKLESSFYQKKLFEAQEKGDSLKEAKLKIRLFEAEERYQNFIVSLEENYPAYHQMKYNDQLVQLGQIQQRVAADERVLSCFWGDSAVFLFAIRAETVGLTKIEATDSLRTQIRELLIAVERADYSPSRYNRFVSLSTGLGKLLLPEMEEGSPYRQLTVLGDGPLAYLPFSVLTLAEPQMEQQTNVSNAYRSFPYLLRQAAIHYGYSATLLYQPESRTGKADQYLGAFAPVYQDSLALSYNQEQAARISELMRGKAVLGEAATEQVFRSQADNFQIIHLAMHGFSNPAASQQAHLLFSQKELAEDARLYAYELYDMQLQADLVVLSACETAKGQIVQGEGVMSLARAFRYAGCPSMISSMWNADGRSSHDIMLGFYPLLRTGESKEVALQQAKLQYLAQCTPDLTHPYYWANYVLIGTAEPIRAHSFWKLFFAGFGALTVLGVGFWFFLKKNQKS